MSNSSDDPQLSIYRILDASINRANEGLRVVEDFVRMSLNDVHLTSRLKELRHGVTQATSALDPVSYTHLTLPTICSV